MKNIVLCFDGTDNKFGPAPFTNALKVFRLLDKDSPRKQICYYQPGIGASMQVEMGSFADRVNSCMNGLDSLMAFSLDDHVMDAYKYLMKFYKEQDKIYMFGFSRGAFIARVLCSMIDRVGLLNCGLEEIVEGAWSIYSAWEYAAQPSQPDYTTTLVDEFKRTFSRSKLPEVEFLGLFDCVNSVGLVRDRLFPYTTTFKSVKQIRHAVSLDERRVKYKQNLIFPNPYKSKFFKATNSSSNKTPPIVSNPHSPEGSEANSSMNDATSKSSMGSSRLKEAKRMIKDIEQRLIAVGSLRRTSSSNESNCSSQLNIDKSKLLNGEFQELWFPGNHGDVGGGWAPDKNGQFISHLPLRWILAEAIKHGALFQKRKVVEFAQRYSSMDSALSCSHDILSFKTNSLTREVSSQEQFDLWKLANTLSMRSKTIPYFRSCEIPSTLKELLESGHNLLQNIQKIHFDLGEPQIDDYSIIREIYSYWKTLPSSKIQVTDGRGNNEIWKTLAWWVVEFLPLAKVEDEVSCQWRTSYIPNFGGWRVLPSYAALHWSIFWRLKYSTDYRPKNLPQYVIPLLEEMNLRGECSRDEVKTPTTTSDDDLLQRRIRESTRDQLMQWEVEKWTKIPDDLHGVMLEFGYFSNAHPSIGNNE